MELSEISDNAFAVHQFMVDYQKTHHYPPTLDEIAVGIGLAGRNSVFYILQPLLEEGLVVKEASRKQRIYVAVEPAPVRLAIDDGVLAVRE